MKAGGIGLKAAVAAMALAGLGACTAQYRDHGYTPPEEDLEQIVVGVDTRDSVAETIGAPSMSGVADESGYYYVESRVRHFAWRAPEIVDRQVLAISFDPEGTVSNIERYGLEDGKAVPLTRRVTETGGNVSFIRQLLSRLGRFSAEDFID
ncbi:MAG: outer membrane protein assembly factor BamE [Paracoccaceae bacterium]